MRVSVNIPEDLYKQAQQMADSQHLSVDEVISSAFAEHLVAWERLQQRAVRGNRNAFLEVLDKVPDIEPEDFDRFRNERG